MATLITGGTGFVGRRLCESLSQVTLTSRNRNKATSQLDYLEPAIEEVIQWDPTSGPVSLPQSKRFDAVVNLMGDPIAEGRWDAGKKERIRTSRVDGTRNLVEGILQSGNLPGVFVSASAIGFYGDSGEAIVEEGHPQDPGFLGEVCAQWEQEALRLEEHGVRVVCLRIGIVIGRQGGALEKMVPIFRWGLGGNLGNGKQWVAWIHVDDLVSMIQWAIENEGVSGPVNATAPNPLRNKELTQTIAAAVRRPALFPAPKFALRLVLGEFANSLFFSQRVVPAAALNQGFQFQYSDIQSAIKDTVG